MLRSLSERTSPLNTILMAMFEFESGPLAGSSRAISVVPTLGKRSTCWFAAVLVLPCCVVLPPHAARNTSRVASDNAMREPVRQFRVRDIEGFLAFHPYRMKEPE